MKKLLVLLVIVAAAVTLMALTVWRTEFGASIEGSRVHAPVSGHEQAPRDPARGGGRAIAEGRVTTYPGGQVVVGAELGGLIQRVLVEEKSVVRTGDLIAEIKVEEQRAALTEAKARIAEIEADIRLAEHELERTHALEREEAMTRRDLERAQRDRELATARRETALAAVQRLAALVAKAAVHSPIDGVVIQRHAHPGEMADVGTRLVTLADTNRVRIEAEVDEFDAGRVQLGQSVRITAEGYPGSSWSGVVEEVPDAVMEKSLRPLDPGRPTDIRVLRVKISLKTPAPLRLGQRVEVEFAGR